MEKYIFIIFLILFLIFIIKYDSNNKEHFTNIKVNKNKIKYKNNINNKNKDKNKDKNKNKNNINNKNMFEKIINKIKNLKEISKKAKLEIDNKNIIDNFSNISDDESEYIEFQSSMEDKNNVLPILKFKAHDVNFPLLNNKKINYYHNYKEINRKKFLHKNIKKNIKCPNLKINSNIKNIIITKNNIKYPNNNNKLKVILMRCVETFLYDGNTSINENICFKDNIFNNSIINTWLHNKLIHWEFEDKESIAYNKVILLGPLKNLNNIINLPKECIIYIYNVENDIIRTLYIINFVKKIDLEKLITKNTIVSKIEIVSVNNENKNIFNNIKFKNVPLLFFNKISNDIFDILEVYEYMNVKLANNYFIENYYKNNKINYLIPNTCTVNLDKRYCLYCNLNNDKKILSSVKFLSLIEGTEIKVFKKDFFAGNDCSLDKLYN